MSRKTKLAFKVTTILFAIAALPGAGLNIVQPDIAVDMSAKLGIPLALLTLVGVWKLLGVAALLAPGVPRLKEWAYAGFFFDLTGAAYLHIAADDFAGAPPPLVLAALLCVSYALRRRVQAQTTTEDSTVPPQDLTLAGVLS